MSGCLLFADDLASLASSGNDFGQRLERLTDECVTLHCCGLWVKKIPPEKKNIYIFTWKRPNVMLKILSEGCNRIIAFHQEHYYHYSLKRRRWPLGGPRRVWYQWQLTKLVKQLRFPGISETIALWPDFRLNSESSHTVTLQTQANTTTSCLNS